MPDYADWTESVELLGTEITIPIEIEAVTVNVPMVIAGTDIQVPVDIQGSYIQMPVDIQGQYITLEIDIVAQSVGNIGIDIKAQTIGNISVNIAASAVTLNVAIQSSAVTLNVNIAASAVTLNVAIQSSAVTLNVNLSSQTANINVNIAAQAGNVTINVAAQSVAIKSQGEWSPQQGQHKQVTLYKGALTFGTVARTDYSVTSGKNLYITHLSFMVSAQLVASGDLMQIGNVFLQNYASSAYYAFIGGNGGGGISFPTPIKVPGDQIVRLTCIGCANHTQELYAGWEGYEI
jgi:hypothetical protein